MRTLLSKRQPVSFNDAHKNQSDKKQCGKYRNSKGGNHPQFFYTIIPPFVVQQMNTQFFEKEEDCCDNTKSKNKMLDVLLVR